MLWLVTRPAVSARAVFLAAPEPHPSAALAQRS